MSLFMCEKCGCVENTASGCYWGADSKLCSECGDGKWHGIFPKCSAEGFFSDAQGFIYGPDDVHRVGKKVVWTYNPSFEMVGQIQGKQVVPIDISKVQGKPA
jgi:hypothetical protein